MTLGELMGPEARLPASWQPWQRIPIVGLTADSRTVKPGYLFAALRGSRTDGSRYIADALARGAAAILMSPDGAQTLIETPVVEDANPRHRLALMAARFFGAQPETAVAVTGTNGKTSVASFVRQLWEQLGFRAASLGTIGVVGPSGTQTLAHTTPDPIELHRILADLAKSGVTHLALEASSHGLEQRRVDGVRLAAGAFTNISRDHLDYHPNFEAYFDEKLRLFGQLLPPDAGAVIDVDSAGASRVVAVAKERGLAIFSVGRDGETLRLLSAEHDGFGQRLVVQHTGGTESFRLPLVGAFQASNALVAAGLCIATGTSAAKVLPLLANLRGARGRLDLAGTARTGAPIFIDYAHTPDALAKALDALRPYVRNRLLVVFGCGGDRDKGKRPQMGAVAVDKADTAIVTDDNPRSEEPAEIRREILAGAPGAIEIPGRAVAVGKAIADLRQGDVLLIAGKGHETGQVVKGTVIPYSDHGAVEAALKEGAKRA
ncbi:MAG TPA: UDP-N-acetylmuramoyl-L-alanyl-D-glutamate--2,6-diaminopimelate ligase [Methyloceanibacter sp.]|jgi:UDP-N-acetylmuramoyl-L-alanyl-D-glutamate--2,6-diaminopimelate ligase|nr:UDP-N-acetylmuramoyl-L-alanyl-D-glutamate--2,6-diaminopimelate ligase [Methyloceanibacter sp.]